MIKILIVEDSQYKLESIKKLILEDLMIDANYISVAIDIKAAKKLLLNNNFDLLILDLVLPLEQGDTPTPDKGVGFLKDIHTNPNLNPPVHIIGLTEFAEFKSKFDNNFNSNLWHLVNYQAGEVNWKSQLKNLISHLLSIRINYSEKVQNDNKFDIAILTALNQPEFDKILELASSWSKVKFDDDPSIYYKTTFSKGAKSASIIAVCVDQMGITASANMATKLILKFKPKYIMMAGICAGLKDRDLNYGDIIVADQSWDYGSGKMKDQFVEGQVQDVAFEPDPKPILLNADLKSKISSFIRRTDILSKIQIDAKCNKPKYILQVKVGPVASGSYVISSESILQGIKKHHRKLLGVEMEAYGLYYSAENTLTQPTKAIMIKSVSDFGDSSKSDDYQEYAAYTSAQFIYHFICEELI